MNCKYCGTMLEAWKGDYVGDSGTEHKGVRIECPMCRKATIWCNTLELAKKYYDVAGLPVNFFDKNQKVEL